MEAGDMGPTLKVNLDLIRGNTAQVVDLALEKGIDIWGVTKGARGDKKVGKAMLDGGVKGLADSRLSNLRRLSELETDLMLLRIPALSEVKEVIELVDISLNSEVEVIKALNKAAARKNKIHKVILMVDMGDRREGILPSDLLFAVREVKSLSNIDLAGIGTNLACFRGVVPDQEMVNQFGSKVEECRKQLDVDLEFITAGNSSSLPLLLADGFKPVSNCYRIGETILLGTEVPGGDKFPLTDRNTFILEAEVIEIKEKPPSQRAILALGRQDIIPQGLNIINKEATIVDASSDHLVVEVDRKIDLKLGAKLQFKLSYAALLRAVTSPYVRKEYKGDSNGS